MPVLPTDNPNAANHPVVVQPRRRLRPRWPIWIILVAIVLISSRVVVRELQAGWLSTLHILNVTETERFAGLVLLATCLIIALLCIKALRNERT